MATGNDAHRRTLVRFRLVRRFPHGVPLAAGFVLVGGIATLDRVTGPTISVSPSYVLAVIAVTWLGTRRHGILAAALAAAVGIVTDVVEQGGLATAALWTGLIHLTVLICAVVLVVALRSSFVEQRRRATLDSLTGSVNRRTFHLLAERERLRAGRAGSPLTLAYFDLDDFKHVNDQHGHAVGDHLLRVFATAARAGVRGSDVLCRIGGDEFVLMLPDTDAREGVVVVDRIRRILRDSTESVPVELTASVGIATYRFPPSSVEAMIAGADELMYRAKDRGGDTVVGTVIVGPWTRWSDHLAEHAPEWAV